MLRIEGPNERQVLTVHASGRLTREDYERVVPTLEMLLTQHDTLSFFIELRDFEGFEVAAAWEDIKLDRKYGDRFGRSAVVGETRWEEWGTRLSNLFFGAEIRYFDVDRRDQAWAWVNDTSARSD